VWKSEIVELDSGANPCEGWISGIIARPENRRKLLRQINTDNG
jgi:hypothetical protein